MIRNLTRVGVGPKKASSLEEIALNYECVITDTSVISIFFPVNKELHKKISLPDTLEIIPEVYREVSRRHHPRVISSISNQIYMRVGGQRPHSSQRKTDTRTIRKESHDIIVHTKNIRKNMDKLKSS